VSRLGALLLLLAGAACGAGDPSRAGARTFDELDAARCARLVSEDGARLVQIRERGGPARPVAGAEVLAPDRSALESWRGESRALVVLAHDAAVARRMAARLVRDGSTRVVVVRGGIPAWLELPADAQRALRSEPGGKLAGTRAGKDPRR
jgi:rhodanese-related sulfurtransferase